MFGRGNGLFACQPRYPYQVGTSPLFLLIHLNTICVGLHKTTHPVHLVTLLKILLIFEQNFISGLRAICVNVLIQVPTLVFIQESEQ